MTDLYVGHSYPARHVHTKPDCRTLQGQRPIRATLDWEQRLPVCAVCQPGAERTDAACDCGPIWTWLGLEHDMDCPEYRQ
jgi:hypothetical protein